MTTGLIYSRGPLHSAKQSSLLRILIADPRALIGLASIAIIAIIAMFGPLISPHPPEEFVGRVFQPPSAEFLLGTDVLGRDVLSRLLAGGRTFILQGLIATFLGVGAGVAIGILLNLIPSRLSRLGLFLNDTVMVIPQILLVLIIIAAFGATPVTVTIAVAIGQVMFTARLANATTQRVVREDYVRSAQSLGASRWRIMVHEVLPNIAGPVMVEFSVRLAICFVVMASLSYLGFGGSGPEWGRMIHENQGGMTVQPFAALSPILMIAVFLIGMNLLRDSLATANAKRSAR